METANDDLMKAVLSSPVFSLLEDLQNSTRVRIFEEILYSLVDEDEDYSRFTDQGEKSSLHPQSLGMVLSGQPLGVLTDLTTELEEASRQTVPEMESIEEDEDRDAGTETSPGPEVTHEGGSQSGKVGVVRETLTEVLADAKPNFASANAVKTGS